MLINLVLFQCLCRLIKEEDKERDKLFILGMITHESDKGMCSTMIVRGNLVIS
jgi:hypothetical protein